VDLALSINNPIESNWHPNALTLDEGRVFPGVDEVSKQYRHVSTTLWKRNPSPLEDIVVPWTHVMGGMFQDGGVVGGVSKRRRGTSWFEDGIFEWEIKMHRHEKYKPPTQSWPRTMCS